MATNLEKKRAVVDKVSGMAKQASLALAVDYQTMTANQMNQLRKRAREDDVSVYVVKNTLARKALSETPYGCMADELSGPLALFFSNEEAAAAARLIKTFAKDNEGIEVKIIALDGELRDLSDVSRLASLPSREQALSILLAVIKEPIAQLTRILVAPTAKLVRTVDAVRMQKQGNEKSS